MMSIPFRGIENEYVPIDDLKFTNLIPGGEMIGECDYIQVWNGMSLDSFYIYEEDSEWWTSDGGERMKDTDAYKNGILVGTPFWFVAYTKGVRPDGDVSPTFTVSGAVKTESFRAYTDITYISTASEEFTMLTNPFPVAWLPGSQANGAVFDNIIEGGEMIGQCDYIQIWNGKSLDSYYVYSDDGNWWTSDGGTELTEVYENGIPAGTPFWFVAYTKGTRPDTTKGPSVTFYNPIAK